MATVVINNVTPSNVDVAVQWSSDFQSMFAAFYIAQNQADLANPTACMTGMGLVPEFNFYASAPDLGTCPALQPATQYYIQAECRDVNGVSTRSAVQTFKTLTTDTLTQPDSNPLKVDHDTGTSVVSVVVRRQGQAVAGVQVTFSAPNGWGTLSDGNGAAPSQQFQSYSGPDGVARAVFSAASQVGPVQIGAAAPIYAQNTLSIPIIIR